MASSQASCLLCLSKNKNTINFYSDAGKELNIINILSSHFWFNLEEINTHPNICYECLNKIESFHEFYESVQIAHNKFETVFVKIENELDLEENVETYKSEQVPHDKIKIEKDLDIVDIQDNYQLAQVPVQEQQPHDDFLKEFFEIENIEDAEEDEESSNASVCELPNTNSIDTENRDCKGSPPQFKCSVCSKPFSRKESYENHELWHTGKSPHKCLVCGKSYTRNVILAKHMESHNEVKTISPSVTPKFRCEFCSKIYTRKAYLKAHISIHTRESQHKCAVCNKLFTRKEHLVNHTRIHSGETPFKCGLCSEQFMNKKMLKSHLLALCRKPTRFVCYICSITFSKQSSVTNHIRLKHCVDAEFKCTECDKRFAVKENLLFHLKSHQP